MTVENYYKFITMRDGPMCFSSNQKQQQQKTKLNKNNNKKAILCHHVVVLCVLSLLLAIINVQLRIRVHTLHSLCVFIWWFFFFLSCYVFRFCSIDLKACAELLFASSNISITTLHLYPFSSVFCFCFCFISYVSMSHFYIHLYICTFLIRK